MSLTEQHMQTSHCHVLYAHSRRRFCLHLIRLSLHAPLLSVNDFDGSSHHKLSHHITQSRHLVLRATACFISPYDVLGTPPSASQLARHQCSRNHSVQTIPSTLPPAVSAVVVTQHCGHRHWTLGKATWWLLQQAAPYRVLAR